MATRDEVIRLLLETEGEQDVAKMTGALRELEKQGGETGAVAGKLADEFEQLQAVDKAVASFVKLKASLADTDDRLKQAQAGLAALNAEFSEADRSSGAVSKQFARAEKEVAKLGDEFRRQQLDLQRVSGTLAKAGVDTDKLANAQRNARTRMAEVTTQTRTLAQGMRNAGDATERAGRQADRAGGLFNRLRGFVAPLLAALGFRELASGVANLLGLGNAAERVERQFARLYGSADAGRDALDDIRTLAAQTGSDFDTLAASAAKLKNFGIEPLDGALQSLVDQNAAVGGSQEDLEGKILAVGQAWAKQKLQGEEILQLVERGVPVWRLLEEATGKNVTELQKLSEAGRLGRTEMKLLLDQIGKENAGAAGDNALTDLTAQATLLRNELKKLGEDLVRDGALDVASESFGTITERLRTLAQSPEFAKLRDALTETFKAGSEALNQFLTDGQLRKVLSDIAEVTTGIGNAIVTVQNVAKPLAAVNALITKPFTDMKNAALGALELTAEVTTQAAEKWEEYSKSTQDAADATGKVRESLVALDADLDNLQISTRTAGETLVAEARASSAAFIQLATDSDAAGSAIIEAFDQELLLAKTRDEVKRLGEGLRVAYEAGKLGADEYTEATQRADSVTAGMAGNVEALAKRAAEVWQALQDAIANGESPAAIAELERQFASLNQQISAGEQGMLGLNNALGETEGAVLTLDEAFKELGIKSKASLEAARDAARAAFETIQEGAEKGTAATEDVSRAWEVYARRVMDVARLSGDAAEKQVAQQLRAQATALGLTDSLEALGLAGEKAGDKTAEGAARAANALEDTAQVAERTADALEDTADAASDLATSNVSVANTFVQVGNEAAITAGEIEGVSDKFKELISDQRLYKGGGTQLFQELNAQTSELDKQLQLIRDQNAAYDPLEQRVRDLRGQYELLSDDRLRQLAQEQMRLEENMRREQEAIDARREALNDERKQQEEVRRAAPPPTSAASVDSVQRLELVVKNDTSGPPTRLTDSDMDQIAQRFVGMLSDARRSGSRF